MKPSVYHYEVTKEGHELYLGESSTIDGLRLLAPTREITITGFEGSTQEGWLSAHQLPSLPNISAVIAFLEASDELSLIDFDASIEGGVSLSTHDDGECHFIFPTQQELLWVLHQATIETSPGFLEQLLRSPGVYMECAADGAVRQYNSFDAYVTAHGFGAMKA